MDEFVARSPFYLWGMGKVGRPKKLITHFIGMIFCFFYASIFFLILYPSLPSLMAVGFLWMIGEVASAFK